MLRKLKNTIRDTGVTLESRWFDRRRGVETTGYVSLRDAGVPEAERSDSQFYLPARPANIRAAIRDSGISEYQRYTFVDLGSGMGRSLLVAAEFPFVECVGVEFSELLHRKAHANLQLLRKGWAAQSPIRLVHGNARAFAMPETDLLLYMFNPFGEETMQCVLTNLLASLVTHPRRVVMALLWAECAKQVAQSSGARLRKRTRRYTIFEWGA